MKKKIIASIVLVVVVVSIVGFYEYSSYESVVVSTTVVTGKITSDQASGGGAAGVKVPGLTQAKTTSSAAAAGLSFITISVPSGTFTVSLSCGTNAYYAGMPVQVADQLTRGGGHSYAPDVACKGASSAFHAIYPHGFTSTTSTVT